MQERRFTSDQKVKVFIVASIQLNIFFESLVEAICFLDNL